MWFGRRSPASSFRRRPAPRARSPSSPTSPTRSWPTRCPRRDSSTGTRAGGSYGLWRPHEALGPQTFDQAVRNVNLNAVSRMTDAGGQRATLDFALVTGDLSDNHQRNEVRWGVRILEGGTVDPFSGRRIGPRNRCPGAPRSVRRRLNRAVAARRYTGVQDRGRLRGSPQPVVLGPGRGAAGGCPGAAALPPGPDGPCPAAFRRRGPGDAVVRDARQPRRAGPGLLRRAPRSGRGHRLPQGDGLSGSARLGPARLALERDAVAPTGQAPVRLGSAGSGTPVRVAAGLQAAARQRRPPPRFALTPRTADPPLPRNGELLLLVPQPRPALRLHRHRGRRRRLGRQPGPSAVPLAGPGPARRTPPQRAGGGLRTPLARDDGQPPARRARRALWARGRLLRRRPASLGSPPPRPGRAREPPFAPAASTRT